MTRPLGTLMTLLRSRLLAGLVVVVPAVVTVLALGFVFRQVDGLLGPWIARVIGYNVPGLGVIATALLILGAGTIATNLAGRKVLALMERVFTEVPFVRRVYGASKDIVESATLSRIQAFREVVMIEYPRKGTFSYGFVTSYLTRSVGEENQRLVNVFIPGPPVPTTGILVAVPVEEAIQVDLSVEDALKLILSAGIACPEVVRSRPRTQPPA